MGAAVPAPGGHAALLRLAVDRDVGTGFVFGLQGTEVARQAVLARGGQHLSGGGPQDGGQQPEGVGGQAGSEPHVRVETKVHFLGLAMRFFPQSFYLRWCSLPALLL